MGRVCTVCNITGVLNCTPMLSEPNSGPIVKHCSHTHFNGKQESTINCKHETVFEMIHFDLYFCFTQLINH
jgi:hypothetical protein